MAMLARFKWLVVPIMLGSLVGFLVSYLLRPQYSARAVIEEIRPRQYDYWGPFDKSASQKLATYLQQTFSLNNIRPLIEREGIAKPDEVGKVYEEIRKNTKLQPAVGEEADSPNSPVDLIYTDSTPQRAEELCSVLTSAALEERKADEEAASNATWYFLQRSLKQAENDVQEIRKRMSKNFVDHKLAVEYAKARESYTELLKRVNGPQLFIGGAPVPGGIGVVLPCSSGTRDFSHSILWAEIGSAFGLLVGIVLISARRKSPDRIAEPHR
jgi:hypothetical protein